MKTIRHLIVKLLAPKLYVEWKALTLRPMFKQLIQKNNLVGAEIGVYTGDNAYSIMSNLSIKKLFLVDAYKPYFSTQTEQNIDPKQYYTIAKNKLKQYQRNIEWAIMYSVDASHSLPNNLDFVYIDANHHYSYVKADLEAWYPKVKIGGLFGGHDFYSMEKDVVKAVSEFSSNLNLELFWDTNDWWIIKNA